MTTLEAGSQTGPFASILFANVPCLTTSDIRCILETAAKNFN